MGVVVMLGNHDVRRVSNELSFGFKFGDVIILW